jgi:hypothetical protein
MRLLLDDRLPPRPPGTYRYSARLGWAYEGVDLYVFDTSQDFYWCVKLTAKELSYCDTFAGTYGKALSRLVKLVWEHENDLLRGH